jgi:preprotein translocase SecF subunit
MTSIAAILTIVGYSLNDTVVVFDRIRELLRRYKTMPASELLDLSINSTLSRTLMVSLATALALIALVIFGGAVIKSFSWAMFFGVVVGTYSSIFIAAPVLIYLGVRNAGDIESADGAEKAGS